MYLLFFLIRFSRIDRDVRGYESRLKQYENEIADLKARCDGMKYDTTRKIEENEVRQTFNLLSQRYFVLVSSTSK